MNEVDFTSCRRIPGRAYNGANGKKLAVEWRGSCWILKFPPSAAERPNDLSYSNSCFSEHLASSIFRMLGIRTQETVLGTFSNGRRHVVCACRDFTDGSHILHDFCSIKNTVLDSESNGTGTELSSVLETIDGQRFVDPVELRRFFWDMFVADAFLGNFDRHNGNWGFLVDRATGLAEIAPVFDCGSCLLPQADERIMRKILADEAELEARIYTFPSSMLKIGGEKIGYARFLADPPEDLKSAIDRIVPRIDMPAISSFVDEVPYLTDLQRVFYKTYLLARYDRLLRPFAKKTCHLRRENG